jgi:hypothetical protein
MDLVPRLVEEAEAAQAVLTAAREDRDAVLLTLRRAPRNVRRRFGLPGEDEFCPRIACLPDRGEVCRGAHQIGVRLEELLDVDLSRRVFGDIGEKTPVGGVESAVQNDARGEKSVVERELCADHVGEVLIDRVARREHILFVRVYEVDRVLFATVHDRVRADEAVLLGLRAAHPELVEYLQYFERVRRSL